MDEITKLKSEGWIQFKIKKHSNKSHIFYLIHLLMANPLHENSIYSIVSDLSLTSLHIRIMVLFDCKIALIQKISSEISFIILSSLSKTY